MYINNQYYLYQGCSFKLTTILLFMVLGYLIELCKPLVEIIEEFESNTYY